MNKSTIPLIIAVIFALAGWILFLKKGPEQGTGSGAVAAGTAATDLAASADVDKSAAELAALEAEKNEAIRMAELQLQQAKDEQKKRIALVTARLLAEESARAEAEKQAADSRSRMEALALSLAAAEKRQSELAAQNQSASSSRNAELAAAEAAVRNAKNETAALKRQQDELERNRREAIAQQERVEAELRAELEKYKEIEDWDYSYAVRGYQYKRQAHAIIQAKINANPN